VIPAALATAFVRPPATGSPMVRWSWRNRLIAALQGHRTHEASASGRPPAGRSSAGSALSTSSAPAPSKAKAADAERGSEEGDTRLIGFRALPVFGYEQTEGDPLPWAEEEQRFFDTRPLVEVARSWDLDLRIADSDLGRHGSFIHTDGRPVAITVSVDSFNTWGHELIHAADLRLGTLNRQPGQQLDNEIVAGLGASVLHECLGYTVDSDRGKTYRYIEHYAKEHDCDQLTIEVSSRSKARKTRTFRARLLGYLAADSLWEFGATTPTRFFLSGPLGAEDDMGTSEARREGSHICGNIRGPQEERRECRPSEFESFTPAPRKCSARSANAEPSTL